MFCLLTLFSLENLKSENGEMEQPLSTPPPTSKRPRDESAYFASDDDFALYRFTGEVLPTQMDERTFPRMRYRSRGQDVKTAVHWGQRKLLISELQLLTFFCEPSESYWIVYVGAAPGSHLIFLHELCGQRHSWELVDPGKWDHRLKAESERPTSRFHLRNAFFDNSAAYELAQRRLVKASLPCLGALYGHCIELAASLREEQLKVGDLKHATDGTDAEAARTDEIPICYETPLVISGTALSLFLKVASERCKMLFISDVRSGSESAATSQDLNVFEKHVFENERAQEAWAEIVNPTFAMLKFRLPYTFIQKWDHTLKKKVVQPSPLGSSSLHSDGVVLLPVWTRPTSTECRLVIPQYATKRVYDHQAFEDAMFFFNAVLREKVHFNHIVQDHRWINHQYDGAAEVHLLKTFLKRTHPTLSDEELSVKITQLSDNITKAIGGSFERAVSNRDGIHITKGSRGGWLQETEARLRAADARRQLVFWKRNISTETALSPAKHLHTSLAGQLELLKERLE